MLKRGGSGGGEADRKEECNIDKACDEDEECHCQEFSFSTTSMMRIRTVILNDEGEGTRMVINDENGDSCS